MSDVYNHTGMFLGHPQKAKVARGTGGGKKSNEGVVFEKDDRAPSLEKLEQL